MNLAGWVLNSPQGVFIEVEGGRPDLESFLFRLEKETPGPASITSMEFSFLDPAGLEHFTIRASDSRGKLSALILPDIAVCRECLEEVSDPGNRRYRYPFTNCTRCGPRYTILESLPYDRPNTSMKSFEMCDACREEYENPGDRRFHAQPNACPVCGPRLELRSSSGLSSALGDEALLVAAGAVRDGKILALKGLGGFHLLVDARNDEAVRRLRRRKLREEKPFALMYPSAGRAARDCEISKLEMRLLSSPESPIVLLRSRDSASRRSLAPQVAPHNPYLGVMLPYTPLHHLLLQEIGAPVIATSGNLSDEPICTDEDEAVSRLGAIADLFLVHNRPIVRHADDSIARVILGRELVLRRARGYAPLPLHFGPAVPGVLAVGGHMKNTVAVSIDDNIFVSQHIGDLENRESMAAFESAIQSFRDLYAFRPTRVAADMHPGYLSSKFAHDCGCPVSEVQHHYAHVAACMAENELEGTVLGVAWDGTGYGPDGTIWGGEFLLTNRTSFDRAASLRRFRLPGGDAAVREPRRAALGVLFEMWGDRVFERKELRPLGAFSPIEISVIAQMLQKGLHSPWTSSAGRLFDAVASVAGLCHITRFEGQAAMETEFVIGDLETDASYPFSVEDGAACRAGHGGAPPPALDGLVVDWAPMMQAVVEDIETGVPPAMVSVRFHNTLAEIIVTVAGRMGEARVALTGGCFQNKYLLERSVHRLEESGFKPYWHQRIPPNDGCIAPGQVVAVSRLLS